MYMRGGGQVDEDAKTGERSHQQRAADVLEDPLSLYEKLNPNPNPNMYLRIVYLSMKRSS